MGKYLYKLGGWAYRKRKRVIFGWLAVLVALGIGLMSLGAIFDEGMSIPGTKSEKAMDVLNKEFSSNKSDDGGQIRIIFKAPKGETLESTSVQKTVQSIMDLAVKDKDVKSVSNPYQTGSISQNKKIGYLDITYKVDANKVTEHSKEKVKDITKLARNTGMQAELGGSVSFSPLEIGGASEIVGIVVAFLILAFTFASFLTAGLPIITAVVGLIVGILCILIGTNFASIQSVSLTLAVMIGLAVGIDYALFILSRYRQQLAEGVEMEKAVARSVATAGSAVVFAGLTVVVALCGLSIVGIPFLTVMGLTAGLSVFVVIAVSITLVPAVIGIVAHRISPTRKNQFLAWAHSKNTNAESNKWGRIVTKYPILIILIVVIVTGIFSVPALHIELGLPDNGMKSKETTERRGYDLMAEGFGDGINGPLVVIVDGSKHKDAQVPIAKVTNEIGDLSNIASITPPIPNESGKFAMLNILPKTGPNDVKTKELVNAIRDKAKIIKADEKVHVMVTGNTAVNIDISDKLSEAVFKFTSVIVIFALALMLIVFRSILVPLKAVLGFIMTLTATLGFAVFVLQDGHFTKLFNIPEPGPLLNFMPVLIIGILFGLAMDYEVFLVSRMREDYMHGKSAKKSILSGMKHSGPVVAAAGLIMISVFASFIFAGETMVKSMGLVLAFGVLFDAFVVRMTLVPAVMSLLGKTAWYLPNWLDRILPNVDIEGESILKGKKEEEKKEQKSNKPLYDK
ncbi:MMPL family transporter [Priestia megaterium]|uniref:MMPL family transporter n=1 Tax=Priestia megaterium TaxID=1404 RepID=UPI00249A30BF|nr:MMPL family transporter [Priestia megaterium]MDI3089677.1 MMPL family transporter [Priestia megaterium]